MDPKPEKRDRPFLNIEFGGKFLDTLGSLVEAFVSFICAWLRHVQGRWDNESEKNPGDNDNYANHDDER